MEKIDYLFMEAASESFNLKPKFLELGSRVIGNQKELSARNVFDIGLNGNKDYIGVDYIGVDYIDGEGVDKVCDVRRLPFEDQSFNTIIAMNLLEHVQQPWLALEEIKRVLSKEGVVILATPFCYEIHGCPYDYYRFTPSFYLDMFKEFKTKITVTVGYRMRPKMVYFIGGNCDSLETCYDDL